MSSPIYLAAKELAKSIHYAGVKSIQYDWSDPKTYVVAVPVASFVAQTFQMWSINERLELKKLSKKDFFNSSEYPKGADALSWYRTGITIQLFAVTFFTVLKVVNPYLGGIFLGFACVQLVKNVTHKHGQKTTYKLNSGSKITYWTF
jgi:hypothetical protein